MVDPDIDPVIYALLPKRVAELADVVGLANALKLVELRGGRRIYVPKKAHEKHWLIPHIGMAALEKLAERYASLNIEIDRCQGLKRAIIVAEFERGVSTSILAESYGCTERNIRFMANASIGKPQSKALKPENNLDWIKVYGLE